MFHPPDSSLGAVHPPTFPQIAIGERQRRDILLDEGAKWRRKMRKRRRRTKRRRSRRLASHFLLDEVATSTGC